MRCLICEVDLPDSEFSDGVPVCKCCDSKLSKLYGVDYQPPTKRTPTMACMDLIIAIRKRAVREGALKSFEEYWLYSSPWVQIWDMIIDEKRKRDMSKYNR